MGNLPERRHFMSLFDKMDSAFNKMDSMFGDLFGDGSMSLIDEMIKSKGISLPKVNVKESKDKYIVEAAVPGMNKEDITLIVEDNILYIKGKTSEQKTVENEDANYVVKELSSKSFERIIPFGNRIKSDVKAKLKDGLLTVTVLKDGSDKVKGVKVIIE